MSDSGFPLIDVSLWEVDAGEPGGRDEKVWLIQPETEDKWLFKPPVEKNGFRQGEDWSEKVSAHLAEAISVPCAQVELATRVGRQGSLSKNLRPEGWDMQPGSLLLGASIDGYQPGSLNIKGRPGHSLRNIATALRDADQPLGSTVPRDFTAFDVFAGYLVLDAWIANRDRHDENWSILLPGPAYQDERRRLCGSYDQASGLGYNVREAVCSRLLAEPGGVLRWVTKGTAYRFEFDPSKRPATLVELAGQALRMAGDQTRRYWVAQVEGVRQEDVEQLVQSVPGLSVACRTFVSEVLRINQERVLDVCS